MTATQAIQIDDGFDDRRAAINAEIDKLKDRRAELQLSGKRIPEVVNDALLDAELELDALTDAEALAERRDRQKAAAAEAEKHAEILEQIGEQAELYFQAVTLAETATREQAAALSDASGLLRKIHNLHKSADERVPLGLSRPGWERRFSERISAVLKTVNNHAVRFGDLSFATSWRKPDENWAESERLELAAMALPANSKNKEI